MTAPRIAITGIAIESSTFSPHRTTLEDFTVTRGQDLLDRYEWLTEGAALREAAEWMPLVHARSLPGGAVLPEVYDALEDEVLQRLADAGPLDGLLLDIHGAMSVVGRQDAEGHLAARIRDVAGPHVLVSASMDLHGNVSRELVDAVDLITCYRMAPHEDAWESRERAARNLLTRLEHGGRPLKAWLQVPVLLPGEKTSTRIEPARSIYAQVPQVEAMDGVLDAAIWVGYAWADEPRCRAAVVVTGDDEQVLREQARRLARSYWDARDDFAFVAPAAPLAGCLTEALAGDRRPFVISDSGDNPTAGGAGDVTWTVHQLLAHPAIAQDQANVLYTSLPDPDAVTAAAEAGPGARVVLRAGARWDDRPAGPVELDGTVESVTDVDPVAGRVAVVRVGGLSVVLTERRKPYHRREDFAAAGVDPTAYDVVVVKIGYLEPELFDLAADWRLALTPGGVDQDLPRLGHTTLERPLHPFDATMPSPDLTPVLLS